MTESKKKHGPVFWILLALLVAGLAGFLVNAAVVIMSQPYILTEEEAAGMDADCILILGCGVYEDGTPSPMLRDRLDTGFRLFDAGASGRILMSGDHGTTEYNEVNAMKKAAADWGIDQDSVFCDHAGFCTYDSIYRAKAIFGAKKVIIVTQKYHLFRALYTARRFGLEAYGVAADVRPYAGRYYRECRECLARCKDFLFCIFKPDPRYLGEPIPLSGPGSQTDG